MICNGASLYVFMHRALLQMSCYNVVVMLCNLIICVYAILIRSDIACLEDSADVITKGPPK